MKLYNLGLYEKSMPNNLSLFEKLEMAKKAGYDFLEISIDETDEKLSRLGMPADERKNIRNDMARAGLPIKTMCLSAHRRFPIGSRDKATRDHGMEILKNAIGFACDLNIRIIQLAGYDVYYEESGDDTKAFFEENLIKGVEYAAREGVVLGFETMETEFMNTVEKALYYVNKVNSPYLNIYPDCGNLTNAAVTYGTDAAEMLENGAGRIVAVHLKETKPGVFREVPFGSGHVNFESIVNIALNIGVRMFVTEFWYSKDSDWKDTIRNTCGMFTSLFENASVRYL